MGQGMVIKLNLDPPDQMDVWQGVMGQIEEKGPMVHLKSAFRVIEYIIKYSRVRTGRSRAAWFPLLDYYGFDYQRSLGAARVDAGAVQEGYSQGGFDSQPFHTTIMNNVNYVDPMNRRYGLFGFAQTVSGKMRLGSDGIRFEEKIPLFEQFMGETWQDFLDKAKAAFEGDGVIAEVGVPPPMQM